MVLEYASCKRTIKTKVLGIGLSDQDLVALRGEVAESSAVLIRITTGISLIRAVEEDYVLFILC